MRDIGGLVWIVFVLIAVVSSIARSARKARTTQAPPRSGQTIAQPVRTVPKPPPQMGQQLASLMAQFAQEAQRQAAPPPPAPPPPPKPVPAAPVPPAPAPQGVVPPPQPRMRRFLADRSDLVRGIIAAEVLGKPLALRDE
ncbi:MAG TPA: hypothetical protein VKB39_01175 [Candidatus Baltobacteraceae bacterium]|nr:hypothetical protein [Candidatus Baltobacteraceae bacterium]